jgi:hypothetical protein
MEDAVITDHIHRIRETGRVRVNPMDTRRFHAEMEAIKKARTDELRREVAARKKATKKRKPSPAPR